MRCFVVYFSLLLVVFLPLSSILVLRFFSYGKYLPHIILQMRFNFWKEINKFEVGCHWVDRGLE